MYKIFYTLMSSLLICFTSKNEEYMSVVETLVLSKLRDYREKVNNDKDDKDDKDDDYISLDILRMKI